MLLALFFMLGSTGCKTPVPEAPTAGKVLEKEKQPAPARPDARIRTAGKLTLRAASLLEKQRVDAAITLLERAISLDPGNWKAYYLAAESWILKNNPRQALEYSRLAETHSPDDLQSQKKIWQQKIKIDGMKP